MTDEPVQQRICTESWLAKAAPRYTSYPPAPFFHDAVTAHEFAQSLRRLTPNDPVSLYLHIPFCRDLCLFCGCHTFITHRSDRIEHYLAALKQELTTVASLASCRLRISHLHFGGGTPNIMSGADIDDLFATLRRLFDFGACREIAMELDPRTVGREQIDVLAGCGVSRVSLGVQDFDPEVQRTVNRVQPYEMVAELCDWLRAAGIEQMNFDVMYGLPLQTPASVATTARQVTDLKPDRVALFSYAHVPQLKRHQRALQDQGIAGPDDRLAMDRAARDVLAGSGYAEIGMDHFARREDALNAALQERRLRRNFQGYTDDIAETLIGIGASAISRTRDGYFQNERDLHPYQDCVGDGQLPVRRGYMLTDEDRLRAAIIEELMCYLDCDVAAVCRRHECDPSVFAAEFEALSGYQGTGLVALQGHRVRLTSPHRMAIRVVAQIFDGYASGRDKLFSHVA